MGWNGMVILLIEMPLCQWLKQLPPRRVMACGYSLVGLGLSLFYWANNLPMLYLAMTIFTFGEIAAFPVGLAYSSDLAPETMRGRYFGLRGMTAALGGLIAGVGIWCYGALGPVWWIYSAVFALIAAVIIALPLGRRRAV